MKKLQFSVLFIAFVLIASACSEKSKLGKFYHNVTARFNAHFNAKLKQEEAIKDFEASFKDDYNQILAVYPAPDAATAKGMATAMDEIIKKSSSVITNHKISKWVDESYFIIGKARYYKGELTDAIEAFQFVYTKYKKEPTANEALIWLGKSYIQSELYLQAQGALDAGVSNRNFPEELKGDLFATLAQAKIKQKNYQGAIENLTLAINATKKKKLKTRYKFILGQLYQANQQNSKAILAFKDVIGSHPVYEMEFIARLNIARLFDGKTIAASAVRSDLLKLLKDDKNIEFRDLLHFELGRVNLKDNKQKDAIFHFSQAAQLGKPEMKTDAYLQVAELYFASATYESAQLYYDSTASFINNKHAKHDQVKERKKYLGDLVKNIKIIQVNDSLLQLSTLSDVQLARLVDKQLDKERKERERLEDEKNSGAIANTDFDPLNPSKGTPQSSSTSQTGGTFYFYNPAEVGQGRSAFITKFGNRKLEDNWRRSKKELVVENNQENKNESETVDGTIAKKGGTKDKNEKAERESRLAAVPKTQEAKAKLHTEIQTAYYNIGVIFRDNLRDPIESVKYFEKLLQKYPDYSNKDEIYFHLSMLFKQLNDAVKAAHYEKLLMDNHKESRFAEIVKNPDAAKQKLQSNKASEKLYASTYNAYTNKNYQYVIELADTAKSLYPNETILAKFIFLQALSHGYNGNKQAMIAGLEQIVAVYPKDPVYQPAFDMLSRAKGAELTNESVAVKDSIPTKFNLNQNEEHVVILKMDPKNKNNQRFASELAAFNSLQFSLEKLENEVLALSANLQILIVKRFKNQEKAKQYIDRLQDETALLAKVSNPEIHFASLKNYATIVKDRDLTEYEIFYKKNYLPKSD